MAGRWTTWQTTGGCAIRGASCNALPAMHPLQCTSCKYNPRKCKKAGSACAIPAFSQRVSGNTFLNSRPHEVVGARGFEPPTPASRTQYSTRLSYAPILTTHLAVLRPTKRFTALSLLHFLYCTFCTAFFTAFFHIRPSDIQTPWMNFQPPFFASDLYSPRKRRILTENFEKGKWGRSKGLHGPDLPRPRRPGGRVPARP